MSDYQVRDVHTLRPRIHVPLTLGLVAGLITLGAVTGAGEPVARSTADPVQTVEATVVATRSAASYLETMAFSRDELIDQLVFEGFTQEQAEYGASQAGP